MGDLPFLRFVVVPLLYGAAESPLANVFAPAAAASGLNNEPAFLTE